MKFSRQQKLSKNGIQRDKWFTEADFVLSKSGEPLHFSVFQDTGKRTSLELSEAVRSTRRLLPINILQVT